MAPFQAGELVRIHNHAFVWTSEHTNIWKSFSTLTQQQDVLGNAVVNECKIKQGEDSLLKLREYIQTTPPDKQHEQVKQFWNQYTSPIPLQVDCSSKDQMEEGKNVFIHHMYTAFLCLFHSSLISGFSSPYITPVLTSTGYLTGCPEKVNQRLLETAQFILENMGDDDEKAKESCIRVRLLHSQVRVMLSSKPSFSSPNILPINEEHSASTLAFFSVVLLWTLQNVGVFLNEKQKESFVALWRRIGFRLGISQNTLQTHFSSLSNAEKLTHIMLLHHTQRPNPQLSLNIIHAISNKPPFYRSKGFNYELTRLMIGHSFADSMKIPSGSLLDKALIYFWNYSTISMFYFSKFYNHVHPNWLDKSSQSLAKVMKLVISVIIGNTKKYPKHSLYTFNLHNENNDNNQGLFELDSSKIRIKSLIFWCLWYNLLEPAMFVTLCWMTFKRVACR